MKKILFVIASAAVLFTACSDKGGDDKKPADPTLEVTPASLQFSPEGETLTIKITTNQDWTVAVTPAEAVAWLSLDAGSGKPGENLEIEVTAEANDITEERPAVVKVTAGTLTKNVTVSQAAKEESVVIPPAVDQSTTYRVDGNRLRYASDFVDGGLYVFVYAYTQTKCWTVADDALSMSEYTDDAFTTAQVFEYKLDETKINTGIDTYASWSAGALKSLATGKYLTQDFIVTGELEDAVYFIFANNWKQNEDDADSENELNVVDQYRSDSVYGNVYSLWYDTSFEWGDNSLHYDGGSGTPKRKSIVYKVVENE